MKKIANLKLKFSRPAELIIQIDTHDKAMDYIANRYYPVGMDCPHCASKKVYNLKKKHHYMCANQKCRKKFNILYGTIFQGTKIPMHKWLEGIYRHLSYKKGISSIQLSKELGIAQSSAYLMIAKIQELLDDTEIIQFGSDTELDELMFGPRAQNMHKNKRPEGNLQGRSNIIKTPILALRQKGKGGKILAIVIKEVNLASMREVCTKYIPKKATIYTDEFMTYRFLAEEQEYNHYYCNHRKKQFVNPDKPAANTNAVEGFWSFLRRSGEGTYQCISRKHLQRYCNEFVFRINYNHLDSGELFNWFFTRKQKTLTYKQLIARPTWEGSNKTAERKKRRKVREEKRKKKSPFAQAIAKFDFDSIGNIL